MHVRYDTPVIKRKDEDGNDINITRRTYNEQFGKSAPEVEPPEVGQYLWGWYFEVSERFVRVRDGVCHPIPPSEWLAWQSLTGRIVYRWEYAILINIDDVYCKALNAELMDRAIKDEAERRAKR